ncbi:uncharacterized protein [Parasteatoda tepidariorum]|uniref:uncharacterized protein n=1 Tax=Parasteatoda tepidariorum TaxID=114398 RepID=UPI00077FAC2A
MDKIVVMVIFFSCLSMATPAKEWKNFENGKVYSRKLTNDNAEVDNHEVPNSPRVEERLLHSHHKDKNRKLNAEQSKPSKMKNTERHHKKSVEEEMHLRPLNERHHKFPNPALLDGSFENSKISRHTFLQQVRRKQNRRRPRGGKRLKRNKTDRNDMNNNLDFSKNTNENELNPEEKKQTEKPVTSKTDYVPYTMARKEIFPVKQTSYW